MQSATESYDLGVLYVIKSHHLLKVVNKHKTANS